MKEIKQFYSLNFDTIKRKKDDIKYLVFHYTGMKSEKSAIKKLTDKKSKVSCHYFIKNNGSIINMVPDCIFHGTQEFHFGKISKE